MRDPSLSQCRPRCPALTSLTDRGHLTPLEELDTFRSAFFLSVFPDSVISLTQVFSQSVWTVVGLTPRAAQTIPYGTVTGQLIIGAMQDPKVSERSLQDDFKGKNSFCTRMVKKKKVKNPQCYFLFVSEMLNQRVNQEPWTEPGRILTCDPSSPSVHPCSTSAGTHQLGGAFSKGQSSRVINRPERPIQIQIFTSFVIARQLTSRLHRLPLLAVFND